LSDWHPRAIPVDFLNEIIKRPPLTVARLL